MPDKSSLIIQACEAGDWRARADAIVLLADHFPADSSSRATIAAATHDPVDRVAFTAIRLAGELKLMEAVRDLISISGWPSRFCQPGYLRKPVGRGAAHVKNALVSILGSDDPQVLRDLETRLFATEFDYIARHSRPEAVRDVVGIPAGTYTVGGDGQRPLDTQFGIDNSDNSTRTVRLDAFYIDRYCVTNERYSAFLARLSDHEYCHPDEPAGKDHRPAHRNDSRFNGFNHPVVGLDWYDAWAFANWAGGFLPSETQWEVAAGGPVGLRFPWGNAFDPMAAQFVESSYQLPVSDLGEWEQVLRLTSDIYPLTPILRVDGLPSGVSPFGASQMSGNVWEMTRTNFFTREDMDPFFRGRAPCEFMNRPDAMFVLKGGSWSSPVPCLTVGHRGRDLLTDRHDEVGFRCAYHPHPSDAPVEGFGKPQQSHNTEVI